MRKVLSVLMGLLLLFNCSALWGIDGVPDKKELKKLSKKGYRNPENPVYVVNGIVFKDVRKVAAEDIACVSIYPFNEDMAARYGDKAKYGVVEIELRSHDDDSAGAVEYSAHDSGLFETLPAFMGGGLKEFRRWLTVYMRYPEDAYRWGKDGGVLVRFTIDERGVIGNITVAESDDKLLSDYVVTLLNRAPGWIPCIEDGEFRAVEFTIPLEFRFSDKKYSTRFPDNGDDNVICVAFR